MTDHNSWWLMDNDLFSTVFSGIHKDPKSYFSICHRTQCDRFSLLPSEKVISFSPRFSCETWDLGRDTFHIVPLFHQGSWISCGQRLGKPDEMPESTFAMDKHLIQGEWQNSQSLHATETWTRSGWMVTCLSADSTFSTIYNVSLKSQIIFGAMKELNPGVTIIRVIVIFRVTICLNSIFVGVTDWLFRHPEWRSSESSKI